MYTFGGVQSALHLQKDPNTAPSSARHQGAGGLRGLGKVDAHGAEASCKMEEHGLVTRISFLSRKPKVFTVKTMLSE